MYYLMDKVAVKVIVKVKFYQQVKINQAVAAFTNMD